MKRLQKLHITEQIDTDEWFLSFDRPALLGVDTIKIDEETARELLKIQNQTDKADILKALRWEITAISILEVSTALQERNRILEIIDGEYRDIIKREAPRPGTPL